MIEKVVAIKNVGRFRSYVARGDVSFRKLTLIYASNGLGKSTLCAILRSMQSGQDKLVIERETLPVEPTSPPYVHICLDGNSYKFTDSKWNRIHPDLEIFDSTFVTENIYSGDHVGHVHKQRLYRVIVGKKGVGLITKIENLKEQIRQAGINEKDRKAVVEGCIPSGVTVEEYLQWERVADIEEQIRRKGEELERCQRSITQLTEIQSNKVLAEIRLPSLPQNFQETLNKKLEDIEVAAEAKVRDQITKHSMGQHGETWLSQGYGYIKEDMCPFCGQNIDANDLVNAYKSHFDTAYNNLKKEVNELASLINSEMGENSIYRRIRDVVSENEKLSGFWKQFSEISLSEISFQDVQDEYANLRNLCLELISKKQGNLLEQAGLDPKLNAVLREEENLREVINHYNDSVRQCNERIATLKTATRSEGDISDLQRELRLLEANKRRFDMEVSNACSDYENASNDKRNLEKDLERARKDLDIYSEETLRLSQESINGYLDLFNTGFRIVRVRSGYAGTTPSCQYCLEINDITIDLGDSKTRKAVPNFKNTLSSGDKSALAFAFFLAALKRDEEANRKIVVLDDPFTSLDQFRFNCTKELIWEIFSHAKQVIVLSHHRDFLKLLLDDELARNSNPKTLQLLREVDTTMIHDWNTAAEFETEFMRNHSVLLKFHRSGRGDPIEVVKCIRPLLEGYLMHLLPKHYDESRQLGEVINKVLDADLSSDLYNLPDIVEEVKAINNYSKKDHHFQSRNSSATTDRAELEGYVKRTLKLFGSA